MKYELKTCDSATISIFSTVCYRFPMNQAACAEAARCGAHSCCAWRAVIWSFAQGERQEPTETLSSLKTSWFLEGRFGEVFFGIQAQESQETQLVFALVDDMSFFHWVICRF